jgi:Skp family chaperone for outer membrane proteins
MQKVLLGALLLCSTAALAAPALAAPAPATAPAQKIGVVNFEKIFDETARSRADRGDLMKMLADRQAEVDAKKHALEAERAQLARDQTRMDPVARARREAQLDAEEGALRKLFESAQDAVQKHERALSRQVIDDARALAPEIGRAHGVTVILGAAEALLWAAPDVVQVDLTAEIARALDGRPRPASAAAAPGRAPAATAK